MVKTFKDRLLQNQLTDCLEIWYVATGTQRSSNIFQMMMLVALKIIGKNDFPYHFKKIIARYKNIGYNIDVLQKTACFVVNPIKVKSIAYLFNCTMVGRASD